MNAEPDHTAILRIGLIGMAISTWQGASHIFEVGNYAASSLTVTLQIICYVVGFVLLAFAAMRHVPRWASNLILGAALLTLAAYAVVDRVQESFNGTPLTTDVHLFTDYAGYLIRSGINPYEVDLIESYRAHRASMQFVTPLTDGGLTGRLPYPALHAVVYIPFQIIGVNTEWVFPLFFLACWLGIWAACREEYRPVILLPFVVDHRYMLYALGGVSDFGWTALLVWMIVAWKHPIARAVLYGLAASYKHHPWLLAPFLLVRVIAEAEPTKEARVRAAATLVGTSVATFFVINLPFVLWNPTAWFHGVTEPAVANMISWGTGPSTLTATGLLVIPKPVHGTALYGTLLLWLALYATHGQRFREFLWLVPGLALFFGHRSLSSYWYFTALPFAAALFNSHLQAQTWRLALPGAAAIRKTLVAAAVSGSALLVGLALRAPPLEIEVLNVYVEGNAGKGMWVVVTNRTSEPIRPAFQVQTWAMQPLFWDIVSGPELLEAGQEATYYIQSDIPFERFDSRAGARLIVSHRGSYAPKAGVQIEGDVVSNHPDAVPNPAWWLWTSDGVPAYWGLVESPHAEVADLELVTRDDQRALYFQLPGTPSSTVLLDTYILLPTRPLTFDILVPEGANQFPDPRLQYGLQLWAGKEPLRVLFGPERASGVLPSGTRYVTLPTPRGEWTSVTVDMRALMAEAGLIATPARAQLPRFYHLDFPMIPSHVQLLISDLDGVGVEAYFGEIAQDTQADTEFLYDEAIREPALGLAWRAEYNIANGNSAEALPLLQQAAEAAPTDGRRQFRLAEALLRAKQHGAARAAFSRAQTLGFQPAGAEIGMGWSLAGLGDVAAARAAFERSLGTPVDYVGDVSVRAEAYRGLAYLAAVEGDCPVSIELSDMATQLDSSVQPPGAYFTCTNPTEDP